MYHVRVLGRGFSSPFYQAARNRVCRVTPTEREVCGLTRHVAMHIFS
jgi:hypothetical protein